jgi:hypothetical protein
MRSAPWGRSLPVLLALLGPVGADPAGAEPYLAVQQGLKCIACHVNPTGGGLRNDVGNAFSQNVLPAMALPEGVPAWSGRVGELVRLGGDLRETWSRTEVDGRDPQEQWELQQLRLYGAVEVVRDRLVLVLDEALAPGNAQVREAYVKWSSPARGWYAKAGRFYLPFGWRLQDDSAFVRQVSGINMTTPDEGVELGRETADWSLQLDFTNGAANAGTGSGRQFTAQAAWVRPRGRLGVAAGLTQSDAGDRSMGAVFGGLRTGPVAWLGEVDYVRDEGFAEGTRTLVAALGEVDWTVARGHNLKLTGEWHEPDDDVDEDEKARWSLVYEYTPFAYVQLRAGARVYDGIPQSDLDNRRLWFLELHGFF